MKRNKLNIPIYTNIDNYSNNNFIYHWYKYKTRRINKSIRFGIELYKNEK